MPARVLHIAPTPFFADRGCHIRIEGIVRCLKNLGYDNTVCTYHHGRNVEGVFSKRISTIKHYTQTAAGPSKYKLWADWKLLWLVAGEFRRTKPVAIHAHLHEGLFIGIIVKLMFFWRRTPLIADIQGSLSGELDTHGSFKKFPFLRWPVRLLERILLMFPDHTVCSSAHSLSKMRDEFGVSDNKLSLAQDGADIPDELTDEEKSALKKQLNIPSDKTLVVYSGALLDAKGLTELKRLIKETLSLRDDLHFFIIGYPTESLQQFLELEQLSSNCSLTGRVAFELLPSYLQLADIAIDPKKSDAGEGSGKMLNYIACGLPVVAFNTSNNRDFLPENSPLASNSSELSDMIIRLAENAEFRNSLAIGNFQQFEQLYSWSVCQQQLETAYRCANVELEPAGLGSSN